MIGNKIKKSVRNNAIPLRLSGSPVSCILKSGTLWKILSKFAISRAKNFGWGKGSEKFIEIVSSPSYGKSLAAIPPIQQT